MISYGQAAAGRGLKVIIAGAGGAAHLPGMLASVTTLPVIGVPVPLKHLDGLDSLLSIVQMPAGIPVATVAVGGARNAGLLAVRILAVADPALAADGRVPGGPALGSPGQGRGAACQGARPARRPRARTADRLRPRAVTPPRLRPRAVDPASLWSRAATRRALPMEHPICDVCESATRHFTDE